MPLAATKVLASRYALALYLLALERAVIDETTADLCVMRDMLSEEDSLRRFASSPLLSRQDREAGVRIISEQAGFGQTTRRFLGVVARNGRLMVLPSMIAAFVDKVAAARGETVAQVVSARPLSEGRAARLGDVLCTAIGGEVALDTTVDPSILGGLIVTVGSSRIDDSIRGKLERLRLVMKGSR